MTLKLAQLDNLTKTAVKRKMFGHLILVKLSLKVGRIAAMGNKSTRQKTWDSRALLNTKLWERNHFILLRR
jgi:hypothetical protein